MAVDFHIHSSFSGDPECPHGADDPGRAQEGASDHVLHGTHGYGLSGGTGSF